LPDVPRDRRLKFIEIMLTLAGFLGIISIISNLFTESYAEAFIFLFVVFIVSALQTYGMILFQRPRLGTKYFAYSVNVFVTSFGGLLTFVVALPLLNLILVPLVELAKSFLGSLNIIVLVIVVLLFIGLIIYIFIFRLGKPLIEVLLKD
jgi:hypothetical protein